MATLSQPQIALPKTKIATTFGLSKDLKSPISVKVCYLECTRNNVSLVPLSTKFEDPTVFKKLSQIYKNSDLFVEIRVYDGKNNNLISTPVRTSYKAFNNKGRTWNQQLKLNIDYNQISIDAYLKFSICEIIDTKPSVFGVSYLSLFSHDSSTLRSGSHKIPVFMEDDPQYSKNIQYGTLTGLTDLEKRLIDYENGMYPRLNWLDKMVLPKVDATFLKTNNKDHDYYLYIELPQFEFPIVYSDIIYQIPTIEPITETTSKIPPDDTLNSNIIINSIDIPMATSHDPNIMKVYDPDFHLTANNHLNPNATTFDPVELKYRKLERNIDNNTILDKELKPTPQLRDELLRIMIKPSNAELTDNEKNLIWKFRYYFSKNNSGNDPSNKSVKSFLPKFLRSINWENDYELDHTFKEIIPFYWSVDKLQIGDALELLGDYFNPYTLGKPAYQDDSMTSKSSKMKSDEKRFIKIYKNVCFLRKLAVERLKLANSEELLLYLLQLVQALKYEALIYEKSPPFCERSDQIEDNTSSTLKSPLADFLIERAVENENLGNFFYWYVKVENEDQLNNPHVDGPIKIYMDILNRYIELLKAHCHENRLPYYKHLKHQIWFIKKLTSLVELLRASFKKNEATAKKVEYLREYLANSGNELLKFPEPFPLPLDPSVMICGCYPEESSVFKSSLAPLKITLKTIEKKKHGHATSQLFGKRSRYGKYPLMFKIGDDLRQDQLVIQIIDLMDQLLKNENLDLKLTPYKILATSPIAGLIQFVPNETLDSILSKSYPTSVTYSGGGETSDVPPSVSNNGILNYLRLHSQEQQSEEPISKSILSTNTSQSNTEIPVLPRQPKPTITSDLGVSPILMDNYVKSCAGYCVITYILGVGDRHLDNLLLSPNGKFWHADFGYILGRDPKPFPPLMKLPIQVIDGMGGLHHENYNVFKSYCFITYTTLRKNSNLILNLFQLMLDANIPDIQFDPSRVIEKVQEKFCLQMTEEEAILHFQNLINDSVNAFLPVVIDRLHSLAQYWRA
ncbi:phosphatidylinositol 3-kinase VPS34 [Candida albicans P57055]|nr:phosphatidylinositol 3-kinase VPS34 [Candida albicans P57055]